MSIENPTLAHFRHSSLFRPSTLVESSLQITPFYAKQTQFPKKSNDVYPYITTDYERKRNWTLGENKPNQSQFKPIKANFKPNQSQFLKKPK